MAKARLLITGGAGYIGTHTILALIAADYDVVIVDNFANSTPEAVRRTEALSGRSITLRECDINDETALDAVCSTEGPFDGVIHFAAFKAVGDSVADPLGYYVNNIGGSLTLCRVMVKHNIKKIVFSSSATVYGIADPESMPLRENAPTGATNPYGHTKHMMERVLMDTGKAEGWDVMILRYFNPVGAHPSGDIGEAPEKPTNLVPIVCEAAAGKRPEIVVFGNDWPTRDGTCIRDYIHVCDLAEAHVAAMDACNGCGTKVYNVGTGNGNTVLEVLRAFDTVCGKTVPYRIGGRRPGDAGVSVADPSKIAAELGWQAKYNIEDMAAHAWQWAQKNPNGYRG
jgi:UDP-glucose 4-epimerase